MGYLHFLVKTLNFYCQMAEAEHRIVETEK